MLAQPFARDLWPIRGQDWRCGVQDEETEESSVEPQLLHASGHATGALERGSPCPSIDSTVLKSRAFSALSLGCSHVFTGMASFGGWQRPRKSRPWCGICQVQLRRSTAPK